MSILHWRKHMIWATAALLLGLTGLSGCQGDVPPTAPESSKVDQGSVLAPKDLEQPKVKGGEVIRSIKNRRGAQPPPVQ